MKFVYELGKVELTLIGLCLFFIVLYFFRVYVISKSIRPNLFSLLYKLLLRGCYIGLFIFALLGPYLDKGKSSGTQKAVFKEIYLALDLSSSMYADDVVPSRLARAKYASNEIIDAFSTDKTGLIIFSSSAFMQCPLTTDHRAMKLYMEISNPDIVPKSGTDLASPLKLALQKHEQNEATKNTAKIIILISDGEDFGEEMEELASEIKDQNIKVFTLGIGTQEGTQLNVKGRPKLDNSGNRVVTKLNEKALKQLANMTNGKYYVINDARSDLKKLINDISQLEGQVSDVKSSDKINANLKYQYFILAGLFLLILDAAIAVRVFKL